MIGYEFTLNCAYCDAPCEPIAEGRSYRFDTRAVAKCSVCNTVWTVVVNIITDTKRGACYASPAKVAVAAGAGYQAWGARCGVRVGMSTAVAVCVAGSPAGVTGIFSCRGGTSDARHPVA